MKTIRFVGMLSVLIVSFLLMNSAAVYASGCSEAEALSGEASSLTVKNPALAIEKFRKAVALCKSSAALRYNLAMAYYETGKRDMARDEFKAAVEMNPNFASARNALAVVYMEEGNYAEAMRNAESAIKLDARNRDFAETLASIKERMDTSVDNAPKTNIKNSDAIAIVIGNRDYINRDIPSVDFAMNDAEVMRKYLIETMGFKEGNVIFEPNATKAKMESLFGIRDNHMGKLYNWLKKGKSKVFVYYSGHGAPDIKSKQGYLVPSDADPQSIALTGYPIDVLYENIAKTATEMKLPNVVIVMDACFSGASEKGLLLKNASPITIEVKIPLLTLPNAAVFASSSGAEVSSWYVEKKHSMFTYFFLKAIKDEVTSGAREIRAGTIFSKLSDETEGVPYFVRRNMGREQTPQFMGDAKLVLLSE